jgi:hypothetical protein
MTKCAYCNSTIFFGGVRKGDQRYCNNKCYQEGFLLSASQQIPAEVFNREIDRIHQGACPKCGGPGPVDVHTSHQIFSVLVLTRWSSSPQLSCRSCGVKSQLGGLAISLLVGWWGIPWGLIFTPVQITRNLIGIFSPPDPAHPSPQLQKIVKLHIAKQLVAPTQVAQKA